MRIHDALRSAHLPSARIRHGIAGAALLLTALTCACDSGDSGGPAAQDDLGSQEQDSAAGGPTDGADAVALGDSTGESSDEGGGGGGEATSDAQADAQAADTSGGPGVDSETGGDEGDPGADADSPVDAAGEGGAEPDGREETDVEAPEDVTEPDTSTQEGGGEDSGCEPDCAQAECGPDGCGGSCGTCGDGTECSPGGQCEPSAPDLCPPAAPYGTNLGDTVSNFSLVGCDNTTLSVHELCENKAVYFFTYTGWCPNCQGHAKTASAVYAELSSLGEDFEMFVVVTEDAAGKAPTKAYCESIEAKFGLTMPVVYDPTGAVQAGLGLNSPNDWHVVLAPGGKLSVKSKYSQDPAVKAVETLLGE